MDIPWKVIRLLATLSRVIRLEDALNVFKLIRFLRAGVGWREEDHLVRVHWDLLLCCADLVGHHWVGLPSLLVNVVLDPLVIQDLNWVTLFSGPVVNVLDWVLLFSGWNVIYDVLRVGDVWVLRVFSSILSQNVLKVASTVSSEPYFGLGAWLLWKRYSRAIGHNSQWDLLFCSFLRLYLPFHYAMGAGLVLTDLHRDVLYLEQRFRLEIDDNPIALLLRFMVVLGDLLLVLTWQNTSYDLLITRVGTNRVIGGLIVLLLRIIVFS